MWQTYRKGRGSESPGLREGGEALRGGEKKRGGTISSESRHLIRRKQIKKVGTLARVYKRKSTWKIKF